MSALPKELLREIITSGGLKTSGDLHSYLKEIFKDNKSIYDRRNRYSKKKVKSQF